MAFPTRTCRCPLAQLPADLRRHCSGMGPCSRRIQRAEVWTHIAAIGRVLRMRMFHVRGSVICATEIGVVGIRAVLFRRASTRGLASTDGARAVRRLACYGDASAHSEGRLNEVEPSSPNPAYQTARGNSESSETQARWPRRSGDEKTMTRAQGGPEEDKQTTTRKRGG